MAEVIKDWDAYDRVAVPLAGALPLKGVKPGRPVSSGEALARRPDPRRGDVHASINGLIEEINEFEIIIRRDDEAVGEPPQPVDLAAVPANELPPRLKELGLDAPRTDEPVIISTLASEPGLNFAPALWGEHRETVLAGVNLLARLCPGHKITWAVRQPGEAPEGAETVIIKGAYPHTLPSLIKRAITGRNDANGAGVFGARELHLLGRAARTGRPVTRMALTLGGVSYFVPVGTRAIDLLTFANLGPGCGDAVILGGLVRGRGLARLERGLDKTAEALHLARRADLGGSLQPCRACGQCARACPLGLPVDLPAARPPEEWLAAPPDGILDACLLCGACALACPAQRPLMSLVRLRAKAAMVTP
ncbi:MAG: hypothetical protein LBV79_00915 [Candidatus Adiutrix sp.]|nr:hypothetical protein [Candidatus Adiutrix sp.]